MNENVIVEERLEALGAALRSRPHLTSRVMSQVRQAAAAASNLGETTHVSPSKLVHSVSRRYPRLFTTAVGAVAMVSLVLLIAVMLIPSPSISWADVTSAIHEQGWIRGTATFTDGATATMWLSSEQNLWAFNLRGSSYFYDGRQRVKYELRAGANSITKLPLGEDNAERVLSMNALAGNGSAVGHWLFGTEKIVSQKRREVTERGKTWIDFDLALWRGDMNQATLRVDPTTRLPVYLQLSSPTDPERSIKWHFDYPSEGPADIYALGVPRDTPINDLMPSDDALAVLHAITQSRESIGDFRLLVAHPNPTQPGSVVWRKGDCWRVEIYLDHNYAVREAEPLDNQNWVERLEQRLTQCESIPTYVCDGTTVWENANLLPAGVKPQWQVSAHTAPQDLMSGEGFGSLPRAPNVQLASLLFPDLWPKPGWGFEFDPQPADAAGCVLLKRSAQTTGGAIGHEWYYVDPAKGHAVVRAELFNLPSDKRSNAKDPNESRTRTTIRMLNFHQAKHGFWYPTVVHQSTPSIDPEMHEDDKHASQHHEMTIRYRFDFAAEQPDSLFTIDDAPASD